MVFERMNASDDTGRAIRILRKSKKNAAQRRLTKVFELCPQQEAAPLGVVDHADTAKRWKSSANLLLSRSKFGLHGLAARS